VRRLAARLCPKPRILFVGINPSLTSARVGHHFAGPGNPFYRLLHAAGFVSEPLTFADDVRLPEFGLALTNIAERATREASELTAADYARGRKRLARTIAGIEPAVQRVRIYGRYWFHRNIPRGAAVFIVYFPFVVAVVLLALIGVPRIVDQLRALAAQLPVLIEKDVLAPLDRYVPVAPLRDLLRGGLAVPRSSVSSMAIRSSGRMASF